MERATGNFCCLYCINNAALYFVNGQMKVKSQAAKFPHMHRPGHGLCSTLSNIFLRYMSASSTVSLTAQTPSDPIGIWP